MRFLMLLTAVLFATTACGKAEQPAAPGAQEKKDPAKPVESKEVPKPQAGMHSHGEGEAPHSHDAAPIPAELLGTTQVCAGCGSDLTVEEKTLHTVEDGQHKFFCCSHCQAKYLKSKN